MNMINLGFFCFSVSGSFSVTFVLMVCTNDIFEGSFLSVVITVRKRSQLQNILRYFILKFWFILLWMAVAAELRYYCYRKSYTQEEIVMTKPIC